jgi:hypothetical protein
MLREEHKLRAFENRVQRRIFGHKRDERAGGCRRLHNGELHNLYASPNITRVIKQRMRWVGHVICLGGEMHTKFWSGNHKRGSHMEHQGVDGRMILEWILGK